MEHYPGESDIREAAADLGYIGPREMPESFYRTALSTPVKSVSHPVKTEWGYHIIKVLDRKFNRTLEQARGDIIQPLKEQHRREIFRRWQQELFDRHYIEYHLDRIKKIRFAS